MSGLKWRGVTNLSTADELMYDSTVLGIHTSGGDASGFDLDI
jgi:hypothetical protein